MAIETKLVELGDRTVVLRELTGADEMLAIRLLSKEFRKGEEEAAQMQQAGLLMALSVVRIDEENVGAPRTLEDAVGLLAKFKFRELAKLRKAFVELNGGEDFLQE